MITEADNLYLRLKCMAREGNEKAKRWLELTGWTQQEFMRAVHANRLSYCHYLGVRERLRQYISFSTLAPKRRGLSSVKGGMMELLSTAPDILSISQDHVPEHLKGRALIFYIKEQDRVILAGWGENAVLLGNLIRKYLEIPAGNYGMVKEALQELDLPGIVLEIYRVLDRIYQEWRNLKTKF